MDLAHFDPNLMTILGIILGWALTRVDRRGETQFKAAIDIGSLTQRVATLESTAAQHSEKIEPLAALRAEVAHLREAVDRVSSDFGKHVDKLSSQITEIGERFAAAATTAATNSAQRAPPRRHRG